MSYFSLRGCLKSHRTNSDSAMSRFVASASIAAFSSAGSRRWMRSSLGFLIRIPSTLTISRSLGRARTRPPHRILPACSRRTDNPRCRCCALAHGIARKTSCEISFLEKYSDLFPVKHLVIAVVDAIARFAVLFRGNPRLMQISPILSAAREFFSPIHFSSWHSDIVRHLYANMGKNFGEFSGQ